MKIILTSSFLILLFRTVIYLSINGVLNLEWSEDDARFDCVVGIVVDGKPIGSGVFIAQDTVLTSANVVEDYVDDMSQLQVHIVGPKFNESLPREVGCIVSVFGKDRDRKKTEKYWLQHGFQEAKENSPLHDLYTLALEPIEADMTDEKHYSIAVINKGDFGRDVSKRYAFMVRMVWKSPYIETDHYMWGGFGYLTQKHVNFSDWMEMEIYGDKHVVVDCDEWVPREWGHFICIENVNNNPGVASGAPLFHRGRLVGIGSFMLEKNNESIHAFTDIRPYSKNMTICINRGRLRNTSTIEFGKVNYSEIYETEAKYTKRLNF